MSHSVGKLLLPAPPPSPGAALTDPALDILADFFKTALTTWIGAAWSSVAPMEPVVRRVFTHDIEQLDFSESDLPLLCVWRDRDARPNRITDGHQETGTQIRLLWVPPPTPQTKGSVRFPFFSAFDKAISLAVIHERDPSWIHSSEISSVEAIAYGSDVQKLAGIDWWQLQQAIERVPVDIDIGGETFRYPGYLATLTIGESTTTDPTAFGVEPTVIRFDLNTGGATPFTTQQGKIPTP